MIDEETHLLLVEDEAPLREATAERLTEHGYRVVQVESGEHALEQLSDFAFDVLLTDLRLPGIDGTEVLADYGGGLASSSVGDRLDQAVRGGVAAVEEVRAAWLHGSGAWCRWPAAGRWQERSR